MRDHWSSAQGKSEAKAARREEREGIPTPPQATHTHTHTHTKQGPASVRGVGTTALRWRK